MADNKDISTQAEVGPAESSTHRLTASEINSLKAAIKAEMARRKYYGSLSATSSYGYADGPSAT